MYRIFLIVPLVFSLGCASAITGHGAFFVFGQTDTQVCDNPESCTTIKGEAISVPGAGVLGSLFAYVGAVGRAMFGLPSMGARPTSQIDAMAGPSES